MHMSIIGLSFSGKTTFFNILTRHGIDGAVSSKKGSRIGTVFVPDRRLDHLTTVYQPKKQIKAAKEFIDTAGLSGEGSGKSISKETLEEVHTADTLCLLIQEFDSPSATHPLSKVDGARDLNFICDGFLYTDLLTFEKRAEKLQKQHE